VDRLENNSHHAQLPCRQLPPIVFHFGGERMSIHQGPSTPSGPPVQDNNIHVLHHLMFIQNKHQLIPWKHEQ
jgi:hypothetical protein